MESTLSWRFLTLCACWVSFIETFHMIAMKFAVLRTPISNGTRFSKNNDNFQVYVLDFCSNSDINDVAVTDEFQQEWQLLVSYFFLLILVYLTFYAWLLCLLHSFNDTSSKCWKDWIIVSHKEWQLTHVHLHSAVPLDNYVKRKKTTNKNTLEHDG